MEEERNVCAVSLSKRDEAGVREVAKMKMTTGGDGRVRSGPREAGTDKSRSRDDDLAPAGFPWPAKIFMR
uniref:Uncharacterized protein n=1 Tax=Zea mays TaxID=4577 RepID=A0A804PKW0_MAIZE